MAGSTSVLEMFNICHNKRTKVKALWNIQTLELLTLQLSNLLSIEPDQLNRCTSFHMVKLFAFNFLFLLVWLLIDFCYWELWPQIMYNETMTSTLCHYDIICCWRHDKEVYISMSCVGQTMNMYTMAFTYLINAFYARTTQHMTLYDSVVTVSNCLTMLVFTFLRRLFHIIP